MSPVSFSPVGFSKPAAAPRTQPAVDPVATVLPAVSPLRFSGAGSRKNWKARLMDSSWGRGLAERRDILRQIYIRSAVRRGNQESARKLVASLPPAQAIDPELLEKAIKDRDSSLLAEIWHQGLQGDEQRAVLHGRKLMGSIFYPDPSFKLQNVNRLRYWVNHPKDLARVFQQRLGLPPNNPQVNRLSPDELALMLLLPELVRNDSVESFNTVNRLFDLVDGKLWRRGVNPLEAEVCLLFKKALQSYGHPNLPERRYIDLVQKGVLALTAPYTFNNVMTAYEMTDTVRRNWGDIGALSLSFKSLKYDSRPTGSPVEGKDTPLLERFGMTPLDPNPVYGGGYASTPEQMHDLKLSPQTEIEFRHGYMLVRNPLVGTLLIRNSSVIFGRDKLPHVAYFSRDGKSWPITPSDFIPSGSRFPAAPFTHIFTREQYLSKSQGNPPFNDSVRYLLDELMEFRDRYRAWKYDIKPATPGEESTAYRSPGFKWVVEQVVDQLHAYKYQTRTQKPCGLAFVDRDFPVHRVYAIYEPNLETMQDDMVKYRLGNVESGNRFIAFLENGHKHPRAELVLIDPQKESPK